MVFFRIFFFWTIGKKIILGNFRKKIFFLCFLEFFQNFFRIFQENLRKKDNFACQFFIFKATSKCVNLACSSFFARFQKKTHTQIHLECMLITHLEGRRCLLYIFWRQYGFIEFCGFGATEWKKKLFRNFFSFPKKKFFFNNWNLFPTVSDTKNYNFLIFRLEKKFFFQFSIFFTQRAFFSFSDFKFGFLYLDVLLDVTIWNSFHFFIFSFFSLVFRLSGLDIECY